MIVDQEINQRDLEQIYQTPNAVMQQAQKELTSAKGQNIHGKDYKTVATRVYIFRKFFANYSLRTKILEKTEDQVFMIAEILTPANRLIATGHAVEDKHTNFVNETSMIENCETSAIGRALASFGLAGDEMASANEVERAKAKQKAKQNNE
tara:strand:+ start:1598 stop:2050 length:453 start_codon:yes stop_codon:yes gene_type:complete